MSTRPLECALRYAGVIIEYMKRNQERTPTNDYEKEIRTILYRDHVERKFIESMARQRYLELPAPNKNVEQALVSNAQGNNNNAVMVNYLLGVEYVKGLNRA